MAKVTNGRGTAEGAGGATGSGTASGTPSTPERAMVPAKARAQVVPPSRLRRAGLATELYRSAVGKKYVMAVSGVILMVYIFFHMLGNLKLYMGPEALDHYAEWLRVFGAPAAPAGGLLWATRIVLLVAFVLHIHAAYGLTRMNQRARSVRYQSKRDYVAADFAARTMRWSGIIVLLFVLFHLADLTFGTVNPEFEHGAVYNNVIASFSRWPVSLFYIVANLALGLHLYHGAWSLFQSLGINNRRFNHWRRNFAIAFAAIIVVGNVSFPIAVLTGVVS